MANHLSRDRGLELMLAGGGAAAVGQLLVIGPKLDRASYGGRAALIQRDALSERASLETEAFLSSQPSFKTHGFQ